MRRSSAPPAIGPHLPRHVSIHRPQPQSLLRARVQAQTLRRGCTTLARTRSRASRFSVTTSFVFVSSDTSRARQHPPASRSSTFLASQASTSFIDSSSVSRSPASAWSGPKRWPVFAAISSSISQATAFSMVLALGVCAGCGSSPVRRARARTVFRRSTSRHRF